MFNTAQTRDDIERTDEWDYVFYPEVVVKEDPHSRGLKGNHHAGTTSTSQAKLQLPKFKKRKR